MRALLLIAALAASAGGFSPARAQEASTAQSLECLAEAVYFEARGTSYTSQAAVAHVVLNRADSGRFPGTPCGVVNDDCQFSYQCDGRPERMTDAADRQKAYRVAADVLDGAAPDPTHGALFFHAERIEAGWFATRARTSAIGGHVFYR